MNDFEKRLSDISHGLVDKIELPDAEQLLDTAKKESATKGKRIERRNAFRRNFVPALAMIILSVVFISGIYYYITHGSLRNPGTTEPTTQSSTEEMTISYETYLPTDIYYSKFMSPERAKTVFSELRENYAYIEEKWTVTGAGDYIFARIYDYVVRYDVSANKIDSYLNLHSQDNYGIYDDYMESLSADFTVSSDGNYGIAFMYSNTEFVSDTLCFVVNFENQEVSLVDAPYHKSDFPEEIRDDLVFGHYNDNEDTGEINSVKLINDDFSLYINEDAIQNSDALYYAKHKDGTKFSLSCLNSYDAQKIRGYSEKDGILNAVLGKMDQKGGSYYFVSVDIKKNKLISEKQITTIPFDSLLYSECELLSNDKIIALCPVNSISYLGNYEFVTVDIATDTATQSCPIPILNNTDNYLEDTFAESMFRPMGFEYMPVENLFNCGLTPVCEDDKWGYINKKGETVIPAIFNLAQPFNPDFEYAVVATATEKNGVINSKGQYIIPSKYDSITEIFDYSNIGIPNGFFILKTETEDTTLYGLADTNGVIIEPKYEYIDYILSDGLIIFQEKGKFGYLNKKGEVVIEAKLSKADLFCNGLAPVTFDEYGKWGYINQKGETVIDPQFDYAEPFAFSKKVTPVRTNEKWGLINNKGEYIANPQFDSVLPLSDNFLTVSKNSNEGLVDIDGNFVLEPKYDYISEHYYTDSDTPQYLMASLYGVVEKVQIFNPKGKMLTEIAASNIEFVTDELFIFENNYKYGLANISGEIIIEATYDNLMYTDKSDRLFASTGSLYYIIDLKGKVLKNLDCDYIAYIYPDRSNIFSKDDKYGIIDSDGEILADAKFTYLESLYHYDLPLLIAQKGVDFGVVNSNGNYLIEAKYDDIYGFSDNYIVAGKDELYAIFYYDGKKCTQITDMKYRMISDLQIGDLFY